ncbi:hypothetical protein D3C75_1136930 [compost metagenome]
MRWMKRGPASPMIGSNWMNGPTSRSPTPLCALRAALSSPSSTSMLVTTGSTAFKPRLAFPRRRFDR